jgi:hypothetical protein
MGDYNMKILTLTTVAFFALTWFTGTSVAKPLEKSLRLDLDQNASSSAVQRLHGGGDAMPNDPAELVRICVKHSQASPQPEGAAELMRMAKGYQCRAAETKVSRQIDDFELDELFRRLNLFATPPSLECIEAMRWVETAA